MDTRKMHGFTLVELMVAITILATVSIVAYVSASGYMKRSYNSERVSAIASLKLSLSDSYQMKKVLPDPNSNALYFDERGTYAHSSSGAYGVSGYVSKDFMPAGYVNFDATDPETHQFYGYGKLLDDSGFSLASVLYKDGEYVSYLQGTYNGGKLASLVRSYASSDFVSDGSTDALPYNPNDRKVTAYLTTWSGSIGVATSGGTALSLTGELNTGDQVTVGTGSLAVLHISDGSELTLGTLSGVTVLSLSSLAYSDDNNLVSRVALFLRSGEVWAKAPHLRDQTDSASEFSIQSDSALAAVRGTVFGMATYPKSPGVSHTDIMVLNGKVEAMKKTSAGFIDTNASGLQSFQGVGSFLIHSTWSFIWEYSPVWWGMSFHTYIQNTEGNPPVRFGVDINTSTNMIPTGGTQTGTVDPVSLEKKLNFSPFSSGYRPRMLSLTATGLVWGALPPTERALTVSFENPGADSYRFTFTPDDAPGSPNILSGAIISDTLVATLSGVVSYSSGVYQLELCKDRITVSGTVPAVSSVETICTLPSIPTHTTGGYFVFEGMADQWDILVSIGNKNQKKVCPDKEKLFAPFGCQDEHLVAYAPYDREGDLGMYARKRGALTGSGANLVPNDLRPDTRYGGIPSEIDTHGKFSNTFDIVTWVPDIRSYALGGTTFDYFMKNSFFSLSSGVKGVFLDSDADYPDSLKYNLSSLGIGNNFSIEMSVRGGALTRPIWSTRYKLFDFGWWSSVHLDINASWFMAFYLAWSGGNYTQSQISYLNLTSHITNSNKFYRVVAKINNWVPSLSILDTDIGKLDWATTNSWWTVIYWTELFIGSSNYNSQQWNDIIDYVKIYNN